MFTVLRSHNLRISYFDTSYLSNRSCSVCFTVVSNGPATLIMVDSRDNLFSAAMLNDLVYAIKRSN